MRARDIIDKLNLQPHPEGGHYTETWRHNASNARPAGTCMYYLLREGEVSRWHKVDATEIWHFYCGEPLVLSISPNEKGPARDIMLGADLFSGQSPQIIIPPHHWQMARPLGDWTLVGCTVSPGFEHSGFTLAHADFDIPR